MITDQKAYEIITSTLKLNVKNLDTDSIEAVEFYLNHDEPEMAFEGLFLELFLLKTPSLIVGEVCYLELAKQFKLDIEPNFKIDFFENFKRFIEKNNN